MTTAQSSPPELVVRLVGQLAERVRREVVLARFIGKFAVDRGLGELRDRVAAVSPASSADRSGASRPDSDHVDASERAAAPGERGNSTGTASTGPGPTGQNEVVVDGTVNDDTVEVAVDDLALADYEHLSSAQIVAKLSDLDLTERNQIAAYERGHRHRRTILGKLEQLRSP